MKTLIAVPCLDEMATVFVRSLVNLQPVGSVRHAFEAGSLVYAARNRLCEMAKAENTDFVLWLSRDMMFIQGMKDALFNILLSRGKQDG